MPETMMQLGPIQFSIMGPVYDTFERSSDYRWATKERLKRRPAKQWIGIGDDKISVKGDVYPLFDPIGNGKRVGVKTIELLRGYAEQGTPLMLVSGTGKKYGRFCILSINHTDSVLFNNGLPRKQSFTMELARYGEDELGERGIIYDGDIIQRQLRQQRMDINGNMPSFENQTTQTTQTMMA